MRNELWAFIKASLRKIMVLYYLLILSLTIFLSPLPFFFIKLVSLVVFWGASVIIVPLMASSLESQLKLVFAKKYEADQGIKDQTSKIAERMRAGKPKKILIAKGVFNACVRFRTLVLGELLLNRLSTDELEGTISHELAHQKRNHVIIMVSATMASLIFPTLIWQRVYYIPIIFSEQFTSLMLHVMICIGLLTFVRFCMIPLNHRLEFDADRIATRTVGRAKMIAALLAIMKKEDFRESSESHPAISERIKRILWMHDAPT